MIDWGLLQDAMQMKLDVRSAVHFIAEAWRLVTLIKNCFVKCGFSNYVSSNDDSAMKLGEDEKDDWQSLQPLGVQFEYYTTCDSALKVCGIQNVDEMLDQHLTGPKEEEEVAEHKITFLDALKELEGTRTILL
jgi:hypothetical protein